MSILSSVGSFFALDIGTSGARVVQLRRGGKSRQLVSFGAIDMQFPSLGSIDGQEHLTALSELISSSKISTNNVAIAAPPSRTFITVAETPLLKGDELEQAIKFQADRLIPSSLDEVQLSWAIMGKSPKDDNLQEVLVASVDKQYAEGRIVSLESLGLNVIALEPEPIAMARALTPVHQEEGDKDAYLVLDMGYERTDLVMIDNGNPRLVRSLAIGGAQLIHATAQMLGINEEQAHQLILKIGLDASKFEGRVHRSIEPILRGLADEVEKSVEFHKTKYPDSHLQKITVTGILSQIPLLPQMLADRLQVNIEIGNTWMNVGFPESMYDRLMSQSSKYSVAVGLALRSE